MRWTVAPASIIVVAFLLYMFQSAIDECNNNNKVEDFEALFLGAWKTYPLAGTFYRNFSFADI